MICRDEKLGPQAPGSFEAHRPQRGPACLSMRTGAIIFSNYPMGGIFFYFFYFYAFSHKLLKHSVSPLDYFSILYLVAGLGLIFLLKHFLKNLCESWCCAKQRPGC